VLAESNFIQLLNSTRSSSTINYREDDPYHISMEDRLEPQRVKPIQNQLLTAIQLADPNDTNATHKEVLYCITYIVDMATDLIIQIVC
jgi:hypothetical protein